MTDVMANIAHSIQCFW